jgi:hypothetical protein
MIIKKIIICILLFSLYSCSDKEEDINIGADKKIEVDFINLDPNLFKNNTEYLNKYSQLSLSNLQKESEALEKKLNSELEKIAEKYTDSGSLMKAELILYKNYEKNIHDLELKYSNKIDEKMKNLRNSEKLLIDQYIEQQQEIGTIK